MNAIATPLSPLPDGIHSRFVDDVNGLCMHVLEAGQPGQPCILLLHGFPELAYSWRKVMLPLAAAGFYVVAPDQRGYGRTLGWDNRYEVDLVPFSLPRLADDAAELISKLAYQSVACVVGHDFGAPVAAYCALAHATLFQSVVLMSAPFAGAPKSGASMGRVHQQLADLQPPRKHYLRYNSSAQANDDMCNAPQGISDFLRAYYHGKSADEPSNKPFALKTYGVTELAKLPQYYVMDLAKTMPQVVSQTMPSEAQISACSWLSEAELQVYCAEYSRTGFQGGLQWYRGQFDTACIEQMSVHAGQSVQMPAMFIAGKQDWGIYQTPGALERMQGKVFTNMGPCHFIEGAGHWVQQEQPELTWRLLLAFLQPQKP